MGPVVCASLLVIVLFITVGLWWSFRVYLVGGKNYARDCSLVIGYFRKNLCFLFLLMKVTSK
jgi:hypothetical protein